MIDKGVQVSGKRDAGKFSAEAAQLVTVPPPRRLPDAPITQSRREAALRWIRGRTSSKQRRSKGGGKSRNLARAEQMKPKPTRAKLMPTRVEQRKPMPTRAVLMLTRTESTEARSSR